MSKELELLKSLIIEELITLDGEEFQLSPDDISDLKSHLTGPMGKEPFNPMARRSTSDRSKRGFEGSFNENPDWIAWSKKVGYPEDWDGQDEPEGAVIPRDKMTKLYNTLYSLTSATYSSKYINYVLDAIFSADPEALGNDLFSLDTPPRELAVPPSMEGLADINTKKGGGKGSETGRGEFVVPFLFQDGRMGGGNAKHDVVISGIGWHVKELDSMTQSIRLGQNTYAGSPTGDLLKNEVGMKASELSWNGAKETAVLKNLQKSAANPSKKSIMDALEATSPQEALVELQRRLNEEMREMGIGDGGGVLFLVRGTLYFVPKDECVCGGATQSAHRVAMPGGNNGDNGPFEAKAGSVQAITDAYQRDKKILQERANQIVRAQNKAKPAIRRLIHEALSAQEKDQVDQIAGKVVDKKWKKELQDKVEALLDKQAKNFFNNDHFYKAVADVWKQLMRVYAQDQYQYARRYTRYDVPLAKYRP